MLTILRFAVGKITHGLSLVLFLEKKKKNRFTLRLNIFNIGVRKLRLIYILL